MPRPKVHESQRQRAAEGEYRTNAVYGIRRDVLTCSFSSEQHVHSAGTARRNAAGRHHARSVCGEGCLMSATSHICLEASDRGTNMLLLPEPLDSPGIMAHELQSLLPKRQSLPRYQVHQTFLAVCLILI
jgi:hypothetical protein